MGTTNIDSYGLSQTFINDDLVHGLKWDANYDGNKLNVGVAENTQGEKDAYFIELDNEDILELLSIPASNRSLDQRLNSLAGDSLHRKKSRKHRHKKSSKHKRTQHKRKHHRKSHRHRHHKKRHHSRKRKHKAPIDRVIY